MLHRVNIIAAVALNGVIGKNGTLPWHIPSDMRRFKELTTEKHSNGNSVIMGRRTFESIPDKKLPGRDVIVLSRSVGIQTPGVRFAHSLEEALHMHHERYQIFIAGGSEVYREGLHYATRMFITRVCARPDGDTFFPEFGPEWCWDSTPIRMHGLKDQYETVFERWIRM